MGKRKSMKPKVAPKRKMAKLEKTFMCPFCNHPDSVDCTLDRKLRIAEATCRVCDETYCTACHALTEPIDVYSEWIDACELANKAAPGDSGHHVVSDRPSEGGSA